jgi:ankyrin repeat protein
MDKAEKLLFKSIHKNSIALFEQALNGVESFWDDEFYASINTTDRHGLNVLMVAIRENRLQMVDYLLDKGISKGLDYKAVDKNGWSIWHYALINGHTTLIKRLLELKNLDVNQADYQGDTPLHVAIYAGITPQSLEYFFQSPGLNIFKINNAGQNALHAAVKQRNIPLLKMMLERQLDPNVQDMEGNTPLHIAVHTFSVSSEYPFSTYAEIVKLLKDAGADPALPNKSGLIPAETASYRRVIAPPPANTNPFAGLLPSLVRKKPAEPAALPSLPSPPPSAADDEESANPVRAAFIEEGLDPDADEHWRTIGQSVVEHVIGSADQPRVLVTTFNFAARQYSSVSRNIVTGQTSGAAATQNIDQLSNTDYVEQAYQKLVEAGKKPPALWPHGRPAGAVRKSEPHI